MGLSTATKVYRCDECDQAIMPGTRYWWIDGHFSHINCIEGPFPNYDNAKMEFTRRIRLKKKAEKTAIIK